MNALENLKSEGVIAVLYGGTSAERSVSLESGDAVTASLRNEGYSVEMIDSRDDLLNQLQHANANFCFIALHGGKGENGSVQGLLECINLPYSGSGVPGCSLAMDKVRSKRVWQSLGLPTPAFRVIAANESPNSSAVVNELGGSVFVKPATEGSSYGMAKVDSASALTDAIAHAASFSNDVLVESYVSGPEFTVAIVGDQCLPSISISTRREFYDFHAKYEDDETRFDVPSGLNQADEDNIQSLARAAFDALGCRDWGRVDVMRDERSGEFMLLEVNTVPGLTSHSLVPMAAKAAGKSFAGLLEDIIVLGLERTR